MNTAELVKDARHRAGLTQAVLAERAGVSRSTIALVESGARTPSLSMLDELLAGAGMQMRVELAPLDADLRRQMAALRDGRELANDVLDAWGCLHAMDEVAYRVEGLADGTHEGATVRATMAAECPGGRFWFEAWFDTQFDTLEARLAPAEQVARHVVVATSQGPIAMQPLDEIESRDGDVARVLRVMRESGAARAGAPQAGAPQAVSARRR